MNNHQARCKEIDELREQFRKQLAKIEEQHKGKVIAERPAAKKG